MALSKESRKAAEIAILNPDTFMHHLSALQVRLASLVGCLGLDVGFVVKLLMQSPFVESVLPFRDNHRGHAVTDQIGKGARLRHKAIEPQE